MISSNSSLQLSEETVAKIYQAMRLSQVSASRIFKLATTKFLAVTAEGTLISSRLILAPFMIHELLLSVTKTAFGCHPCRVVSVTYRQLRPFHDGNPGSNPVGDANLYQLLAELQVLPHYGLRYG